MAKDPAILFYTSDFLSGTAFFTDEQRGQYIKLLCEQHQNGHIPESHLLSCVKSYDSPVFKKFKKDSNGLYYQERMEKEIQKRLSYSESRRNNRFSKNKEIDMSNHMSEDMSNHMSGHMENGNENIYYSNLGIIEEYWEKWKKYKKAEHNFHFNLQESEDEAKKILLTLSENNAEMAMKIIDYSIACGYKKFVKPEKDKKNGGKSTTTLEERANIAANVFGTNSAGNCR